MSTGIPHRRQTKRRLDIALTKSIANAIVTSIQQGKPYTKHAHGYLLVDVGENSPPISVHTYSSWLRRRTVPTGCRKSLREMVEEARRERKAAVVMETLDPKKYSAFLETSIYVERIREYRFGKNTKMTVVTTGTDVKLVALKWKITKYVLEKVDPAFAKPSRRLHRRVDGLTLKKMRWSVSRRRSQ